jgi:hypothetical protein
MDPYAPINGISLERYAELSADVSDTQDPNKQAEIVAQKGVSRADWEAAKAGWTARMQDMSLMGQVATRFMPLYQAALAKKSPAPQVSFEDYVAMSGCVPVIGIEGMLAHYEITMAQWTQIAGHWNSVIPTNPQYMQYAMMVQAEAARIRAGGQPRPVNLAVGGVAAPAAPAQPPAPQPYAQQPGYAQPHAHANPFGTPQQQQAWNAQAANVGNQIGSAFNAFGSALGSFVDGAVGGIAVGARVMVQWSDGNRYPGTVARVQSGQVQVAFPDGRQVWVPQQYVSVG